MRVVPGSGVPHLQGEAGAGRARGASGARVVNKVGAEKRQRRREDVCHQFIWQWLTKLTPVSPELVVTASGPEKAGTEASVIRRR
jgi:hypothetical protein